MHAAECLVSRVAPGRTAGSWFCWLALIETNGVRSGPAVPMPQMIA